jgi:cellulose synthase/poly-beta-1,6-N-acetylglucosamine synthase-like glycosyltransferase
MALPWKAISAIDFATDALTEDAGYGLALSQVGMSPVYEPAAAVISHFPTSSLAEKTQRSRWERGHLTLMRDELPALIRKALITRNLDLLALSLDMAVPPLSLLAIILLLNLGFNLIAVTFVNSFAPFVASIVLIGLFVLAVFYAWGKFGRDLVSMVDFLSVPFYIGKKLPSYIILLFSKSPAIWIRTRRDKQ